MRYWLQFLLIIVLITAVNPVMAQDDTNEVHPLLQMLSYVPDTPENRIDLYYADMKTAAETVIGESRDTISEAWESIDGYPDSIWVGWIPYAMPPPLLQYMGPMLSTLGEPAPIDITTIEYTLAFGRPPATGMILQGVFNNEAIVASYTAETHEIQSRDDDITLLCSIDGCEEGLTTNPQARDLTNIFGGFLGRQEPIALLDGLIFNSADINVVDMMLQAYDDRIPSLADSADFQAAIGIATEQGVMRQAAFYAPEPGVFVTRDSLTELNIPDGMIAEIQSNISFVPPFRLVMFAETADIDTGLQKGIALLVYENEADANTALTSIRNNLQSEDLMSIAMGRTYNLIMTERGELGFERLEHPDTGRHVVIVSIESSLVQLPDPEAEGRPELTGLQFRLFLDMTVRKDTLWMMTSRDGG